MQPAPIKPAGDGRPSVLVLADVRGWAWHRKAEQLVRHLSGGSGANAPGEAGALGEFDVQVYYTTDGQQAPRGFDLYHTFDFPNTDHLMHLGRFRALTGLTAHVLPTWGDQAVAKWAARAVGLHGNSRLIVEEIRRFHPVVHYLPNGVDEQFWCRTRPRSCDPVLVRDRVYDERIESNATGGAPGEAGALVVGHVGKANPRKGLPVIEAACRIARERGARLELRAVQRVAKTALAPDVLRDFYQDLHVLAVASDFDGTPNPALEAASCEVAVVGNVIGNLPELLGSSGAGILLPRVERGRLGELAEPMADALCELAHDLPMAEAMGKRAREAVLAGWTWKIQAENYRRAWREALACEPKAF